MPHVAAHENFFDLGGYSLLALSLIGRVKARFSVDISVRTLFDHQTLEDFSKEVTRRVTAMVDALPEGDADALLLRSESALFQGGIGKEQV